MQKYALEFILHSHDTPIRVIKSSLEEFGGGLEIIEQPQEPQAHYQIKMTAEEPTLVFDVCAQFGRIKSARVDEIK